MSKVKATASNKPIVLDVLTFRLKANAAYSSSVRRVTTARLRCGVSFHITVDRLGLCAPVFINAIIPFEYKLHNLEWT